MIKWAYALLCERMLQSELNSRAEGERTWLEKDKIRADM